MIEIYTKDQQAYGEFNQGDIIENKPIGFPIDGGTLPSYSNIFYWAHAVAKKDSTIGLHPHKGFEIITFVLEGTIKHYDTLLKKWITLKKGDVQVIKSGSGISHSEALNKDSEVFQIWFDPDLKTSLSQNAEYQDYNINELYYNDNKRYLIGNKSPIKIDTESIEIYEIEYKKEKIEIPLDKNKYYSLYILSGKVEIKEKEILKDSFIIIYKEKNLIIQGNHKAKIFCIESPLKVSYKTYIETIK